MNIHDKELINSLIETGIGVVNGRNNSQDDNFSRKENAVFDYFIEPIIYTGLCDYFKNNVHLVSDIVY